MNVWQRIFGYKRRGTPLSQAPPHTANLFSLLLGGNALDLYPIKSKRQALELYAGWVYVAVKCISDDVMATGWDIWQQSRGGKLKLAEGLQANEVIAVLNKPNSSQSWSEFVELTQLHLDLAGEAWWYCVTNGSGKKLLGLQILYPSQVQDVVLNEDKLSIRAWRCMVGTQYLDIPASDIIQIKTPNPQHPYRGMSPLEANASSQYSDLHAKVYGSEVYKNRAVPEVVLSTDQVLSKEQQELVASSWIERFRGKQHEVAVLSNGSKVQVISQTLKDLEFANRAKLDREQILAAYGVPASKVGLIVDSNRANSEEADKTYRANTLLPRLTRIERAINTHVLPRLGVSGMVFRFESPVLGDRAFDLKQANDGIDRGCMTINEWREKNGLEPRSDGDVLPEPRKGGVAHDNQSQTANPSNNSSQ